MVFKLQLIIKTLSVKTKIGEGDTEKNLIVAKRLSAKQK
jgi:hypothetical protein